MKQQQGAKSQNQDGEIEERKRELLAKQEEACAESSGSSISDSD